MGWYEGFFLGGGLKFRISGFLGERKIFLGVLSFNLSGDFCRVPKKMRRIAVKKIVT